MIAADTSSIVAYLSGESGHDVMLLDECLENQILFFPPIVLTELLSDPKLPRDVKILLQSVPMLEIKDGYWTRVGLLRARLIQRKLKARVADALVAQACLDNDVGLITRDSDFRHYQKFGGLKLLR